MAKHGLGKGLGALLSDTLGADSSEVRSIPLSQIRSNPYQPRTDFPASALGELAESIRQHGILQPVLLRRTAVDSYELIAGERRYRAAKLANLETVPALIREIDNRDMLEFAIIENVQREDINVVDAAASYQRLNQEFGLSQEDIAKRIGKSRASVANTMRLLNLPELAQSALKAGEISEGHGRALLSAAPHRIEALLNQVKERSLSVRETEALARSADTPPIATTNKDKKTEAQTAAEVSALVEQLETALKTKIRLKYRRGFGHIEVEFYSDEQLEGIVEQIVASS